MKTSDTIIAGVIGALIGFSIQGIEGLIIGFIVGFIVGDSLKNGGVLRRFLR